MEYEYETAHHGSRRQSFNKLDLYGVVETYIKSASKRQLLKLSKQGVDNLTSLEL